MKQNKMKSAKQLISDVIKKLQNRQKNITTSSQDSYDTSLSAFDLMYQIYLNLSPIHFTGIIEDYLFRQSREIFDILKENTDQDIEGITYNQIRNDGVKLQYYKKVRQNIPKYYALKPSDRQKYFEIQGEVYLKKLGMKPEECSKAIQVQNEDKKQFKPRQATPIKFGLTKKQSLQEKKEQKKKIIKDNIKGKQDNIINLANQIKMNEQQKYGTPEKKQKEKKKVKFFQFQYVKDFSQYKTPKRLALTEQLIEPLKEQELSPKIQHK